MDSADKHLATNREYLDVAMTAEQNNGYRHNRFAVAPMIDWTDD